MATPSIAEVIRAAIESQLADVHTCLPGRVVSYDPATQQADVQIVVRRASEAADGSTALEDFPVLPAVPVAWMRGGGYSLQFPLAKGDHVWLMFSEAAMGFWRASGQVSEPGDLARHSLSYPIALPCIAPDAAKLPPVMGDEAVLQTPGYLRVGGPAAQEVALASLVDARFSALQAAIVTALGQINTASVALTPPNPTAAATVSAVMPTPIAASKLKAE